MHDHRTALRLVVTSLHQHAADWKGYGAPREGTASRVHCRIEDSPLTIDVVKHDLRFSALDGITTESAVDQFALVVAIDPTNDRD